MLEWLKKKGVALEDRNYTKKELIELACLSLGIDTVSGFTSIVINSEIVLDRIFPYFVNSNTILFSNLTGKILLGSWFFQDNWLQSLGSVSNLRIYQRKLTSKEIIQFFCD